MSLPAPYNFVSLANQVVEAPTPDRLSHDVPFSDGISGWLDLELTAHTPLCVGHTQTPDPQRGTLVRPFRTPDGELAIPGSSLRGLLRSVVEIAAFGKLQFVNTQRRYAVRDLQNRQLYVDHMAGVVGKHQGQPLFASKTRAGFLVGGPEAPRIVPCQVARVEHDELLRYLRAGDRGRNAEQFQQVIGKRSSLKEKYQAWGDKTDVRFTLAPEHEHPMSSGRGYLQFAKAVALGTGDQQGQVVFSGQIGARKDGKGKHREFLFYGADDTKALKVEPDTFADFEANHSDDQGEKHGGQTKPNEEWGYWKKTFQSGGRVPVFYLVDENDRTRITSLGLAQMYRLAYKHSIGDAVRNSSREHLGARTDFAEALFGRAGTDDPLARRVTLGLFRAQGNPELQEHGPTVQGAPKPTYYPAYVKQKNVDAKGRVPRGQEDGKPRYQTFMDDGVELSGWKRYPVRPQVAVPPVPVKSKPTVWLRLEAVAAGARFRGRLRVHNLRPVELGALLWALDFGGRPELRHSLGLGKAMGFGAVSFTTVESGLAQLNPDQPADLAAARAAFEQYLADALGCPLNETEQVILLQAMADPAEAEHHDLRHPTLGQGRDGNEFKNAVKAGEALRPYVDAVTLRKDREAKRKQAEQLVAAEIARKEEAARAAAREAELAGLTPLERSVREVLDAKAGDVSEEVVLFQAWTAGHWEGADKLAIAHKLHALMQTPGKKNKKATARAATIDAFLAGQAS